MQIQVQVVKKSSNKKTGAITITNSNRPSCPKICPFNNGNGCYAESGYHTSINWNKVDSGERGGDWNALLTSVEKIAPGSLWRHNVSGDLPHCDEIIDSEKVESLTRANTGKMGFTYTHHDMNIAANRDTIERANQDGFTINLSANNLAHADQLSALDIAPVVTVCEADKTGKFETPGGRPIIVCPATYKDEVTCKTCKLCARQRNVIVAFPVHGRDANKIEL